MTANGQSKPKFPRTTTITTPSPGFWSLEFRVIFIIAATWHLCECSCKWLLRAADWTKPTNRRHPAVSTIYFSIPLGIPRIPGSPRPSSKFPLHRVVCPSRFHLIYSPQQHYLPLLSFLYRIFFFHCESVAAPK